MPDITLCVANFCPYRDTCYRYKAKPNKLQSYNDFIYTCNESNGFKHYIAIRRDD